MKVWQRGYELVSAVYRLTAEMPADERYGLISQTRRAAVSVIANIAEGSKRIHRVEASRFLNIAEGSLAECEALLRVGTGMQFIPFPRVHPLWGELDKLARMSASLRRTVLKQDDSPAPVSSSTLNSRLLTLNSQL
ncbi:MAG: four helix bundle protein [Acidobacteriota bacterium]